MHAFIVHGLNMESNVPQWLNNVQRINFALYEGHPDSLYDKKLTIDLAQRRAFKMALDTVKTDDIFTRGQSFRNQMKCRVDVDNLINGHGMTHKQKWMNEWHVQ